MRTEFFKLSFFFRKTNSPAVIVIIPSPPTWMRRSITIFPKSDQCAKVGTTTRPVTQTDVVAVKRASIKGVISPEAEDMGSIKITAPRSTARRKLKSIMCVVVNLNFIYYLDIKADGSKSVIAGNHGRKRIFHPAVKKVAFT